MIRTQIYITSTEKKALAQMARHTGQSQSELIRMAIDLFCRSTDHSQLILNAKGIWEDHDVDLEALRQESNREFL